MSGARGAGRRNKSRWHGWHGEDYARLSSCVLRRICRQHVGQTTEYFLLSMASRLPPANTTIDRIIATIGWRGCLSDTACNIPNRRALRQASWNRTRACRVDGKRPKACAARRAKQCLSNQRGSRARGGRIAVIIAGMTRSFLSQVLQRYWSELLATLAAAGRRPVVLAALTRSSSYRHLKGWLREENVTELSEALGSLGVDFRIGYLRGVQWKDAAGHVCHPAIRQALTPKGSEGGKLRMKYSNLGFIRRALALDMLLRFEFESGSAVGHVLLARPDVLYPPLMDSKVASRIVEPVEDAVILVNDQLALTPRWAAGPLLMSVVMHRFLYGRPPEVWPSSATQRLRDSLIRNARGSLAQPTTFLALHGVLFAGLGLEIDPPLLPLLDKRGQPHPFAREPHPVCPNALLREVPVNKGDKGNGATALCVFASENGEPCLGTGFAKKLEAEVSVCERVWGTAPRLAKPL